MWMESLGKIHSSTYSLNRRFIKMFLLFNQIRENGKSHSWFRFEISIIVTKKNEKNNEVFSMPKRGRNVNKQAAIATIADLANLDQQISALVYQIIMILLKFKIWLLLLEIWVMLEKFCNVILYSRRAPKMIDPSAEITIWRDH